MPLRDDKMNIQMVKKYMTWKVWFYIWGRREEPMKGVYEVWVYSDYRISAFSRRRRTLIVWSPVYNDKVFIVGTSSSTSHQTNKPQIVHEHQLIINSH